MTIKHKCGDNIVENVATSTSEQRSSYHENFHYEGSGWLYWIETYYTVSKCTKCGKSHRIKENQLL
jgi:hypothetical protein